MQRLDGERHLRGACFRKERGYGIAHLLARAAHVLRSLRQPADHEHQALRAELVRFFEGAAVIVAPIGRGEKAAAAKAGDRQAVGTDRA